MAEVGSAFVSILPSAKGFGSKLNSEVGGEVDGAGKKVGSRFGTALKVGALAAIGGAVALGGFLKGAVDDASDLAESTSKVGVVFGKSSGQIIAASKSSATAMGLTKAAYLGATGTLGNLLVSLDIAPKAAADMSQEMVKLAGDLASFNNVSPEEALEALRAGLVGETEPLKKFGVNMNEATLKAQALKMGLIETTTGALDPQTKALAAQALIMEQTTTAQGDFARTSGGLANQQRILSAQFGDLKATIGEALLPVVTSFVTFLNSSMIPAFSAAWSFLQTNVVPIFGQVRTAIQNVIASLGGGGGGGLMAAFAGIGAFITGSVIPAFMGIVRAVQNFVATALPIVQQFVAGMRDRIEPLMPLVRQIFTQIGSIITGAMKLIQTVIQAATSVISAVWNKWGSSLMTFAAKIFGNIATVISGALKVIQGIIKVVTSAIKGDWSGVWDGIKQIVSGAWSVIKGVVQGGVTLIRGIISGAAGVLKAAMVAVWEAVKSAIRSGIESAVGLVREMPGKARAALGNVSTLLYSAGQDLVRGLINGIKAMASSVASAASDVVGNAIDAAKSKLGISSPSKVFTEIGEDTAAGLVKGLEKSKAAVESAMDKVIDALAAKRSRLKDLKSEFESIVSNVGGAFTSDVFAAESAGDLLTTLKGDIGSIREARQAFNDLTKMGASKEFSESLLSSGNVNLIKALSQGSREQLLSASGLYDRQQAIAQKLGNDVATNVLGKSMDNVGTKIDGLRSEVQGLRSDQRDYNRRLAQLERQGAKK